MSARKKLIMKPQRKVAEEIKTLPLKSDLVPAARVIRKHRFKSGTVALRQIRKLQKTVENLLPRLSFERVVREIAQDFGEFHFQKDAINSLQCASEEFLVSLFSRAQLFAIHSKRKGIFRKDMKLALTTS
jgi:histone H3